MGEVLKRLRRSPAAACMAWLLLAAPSAGQLHSTAAAGCVPDWIPTFGGMPGTGGVIHALAVFDDGTGPALYAGGDFASAGGKVASRIARWDGQAWSALGSGLDDTVWALLAFDDGSGAGSALYAAGAFTTAGGLGANHIARWDGQAWSELGSGTNAPIFALAAFDDGSGAGPALHAGGAFLSAGGVSANRMARWDGQGWSALGSGTSGAVHALAVFDDGSGAGPALCAGGQFFSAGGQVAKRVARWDGASWSKLGSGIGDETSDVRALAVFDDGSGAGPALYAGGLFTSAGGQGANRIARWDGQGWSALGSGLSAGVSSLAVFDDGSGAALYAGGSFTTAGGEDASQVARWDGQGWGALGGGLSNDAQALVVFDDGSGAGPALCAGGSFTQAGGEVVNFVAGWDGRGWSALGTGVEFTVYALASFDDGSGAGAALYAGGNFTQAGGGVVNHIARWDGHAWSPLASGTDGIVYALAAFDDGSGAGPALYAGGTFTTAGGEAANGIARWDGQAWSPLASGAAGVHALAVFDGGSGAELYAGGDFTSAGGQAANHVARWNGAGWSALAGGVDDTVHALTVFDDGLGAGPALVAGGEFTSAGGQAAQRIARWDGRGWSALGDGVELGSAPQTAVRALAVFDGGSGGGPALHAAGAFTFAGGQPADNIARWDGRAWSALAGGLSHPVNALTVFVDGSGAGPALYAGGQFTSAGGVAAGRIARWDGLGWAPLGSGMDFTVYALAAGDGGGAASGLYAGGWFAVSPAGDSYLARWACPAIAPLPGCFGNPAALVSRSSAAALGQAFDVALSSAALPAGLGLLYLGTDGTDAAGCGLFAPGLGELLLGLAPVPPLVGSGALSAGAVEFALPVPDDPGLVGIEVALQGAVVGLAPGLMLELSNGLLVAIAP